MIPRVVVDADAVKMRGLVSTVRIPVEDVQGVEMVEGRVGHYWAWVLELQTAHRRMPFAWLAFHRHDLIKTWVTPEPPHRAERLRAEIEQAVLAAQDQHATRQPRHR